MSIVTHADLQELARQEMVANGFEPAFPPAAEAQLAAITSRPPAIAPGGDVRDLRSLLWSSIDNDTSRDLDQIEVAELLPGGVVRVLVGIADVDAFVAAHTPIDDHAGIEATTVYAGVKNFPMLPNALSTGATSLLEGADKLCLVVETVVAGGIVQRSDVYRAVVRNKAQLTYDAVGAWLESRAAPPAKVASSADLQAQLKLQSQVAQALRRERFRHGALDIDTIETRPVVLNEQIVDLARQTTNEATELIEDFMIASNGAVARLFESRRVSSIRRIVRSPRRWDRIVEAAASLGTTLPATPDSKALNQFLDARRSADPDRFPDLSLAVIKLMGPGEYVLERPGDRDPGHFGLAVQDYTHSTAPNRRFADLVTQRQIKALLAGRPVPYSDDDLSKIASTCTAKEDAARRVERAMAKRIAAVAMGRRIGDEFDGIVTGVTPNGMFVRILQPHVEGLLAQGQQGLDVGDRLRVKLIRTDVERGYIDFARV
jgi:exoribonuclease-2